MHIGTPLLDPSEQHFAEHNMTHIVALHPQINVTSQLNWQQEEYNTTMMLTTEKMRRTAANRKSPQ